MTAAGAKLFLLLDPDDIEMLEFGEPSRPMAVDHGDLVGAQPGSQSVHVLEQSPVTDLVQLGSEERIRVPGRQPG